MKVIPLRKQHYNLTTDKISFIMDNIKNTNSAYDDQRDREIERGGGERERECMCVLV